MRYSLPIEEIETLRLYQHNVSDKEYIKATGILMPAKDLSVETVSNSLGSDTTTVYRYWSVYKEAGSDSFLESRHKGYRGIAVELSDKSVANRT